MAGIREYQLPPAHSDANQTALSFPLSYFRIIYYTHVHIDRSILERLCIITDCNAESIWRTGILCILPSKDTEVIVILFICCSRCAAKHAGIVTSGIGDEVQPLNAKD